MKLTKGMCVHECNDYYLPQKLHVADLTWQGTVTDIPKRSHLVHWQPIQRDKAIGREKKSQALNIKF